MKIRETRFEDFPAVREICLRNGMALPDYFLDKGEARGSARFRARWTQNPIWQQCPGPIGWVMENEHDTVVGTVANHFQAFELDGERLIAGVIGTWVVDRDYRGESLGLASHFLYQKNVDFTINTTANKEAEKVFRAFRAQPVPCPHYDQPLFWVTGYPGFIKSAMRKKKLPGLPLVHHPTGWLLRLKDLFSGRNRFGGNAGEIREALQFDDRFDSFWQSLKQTPGHLLAVRDHATLTWHFGDALSEGRARVLTLEKKSRLRAYAVIDVMDQPEIGLRRWRVADLRTEYGDEASVLALVSAAARSARNAGVHMLELIGFHSWKRAVLEKLNPYRRRLPSWPYLYRAGNRGLAKRLARDVSWDPCPYDGDASIG